VLRNALDALPPRGGKLGLRVTRDGEQASVEVADDGRGMAGDLIERVLSTDPFAAGEEARAGLTLARGVAERHGGTLEVLSEPDRGTVVRLSVPADA